jgi:Zinc-binding loop region of homing endonuclease
MPIPTEQQLAILHKRVLERLEKPDGEEGCHLFVGTKKAGYGVLTYREDKKKKFISTHKVVMLFEGRVLKEGEVTRHTCGNPACCNPLHLIAGTQGDNMKDRRVHGTAAKGARNGRARLTAEQVARIRSTPATHGSKSRLAKEFGVHPSTISLILKGEIWTE